MMVQWWSSRWIGNNFISIENFFRLQYWTFSTKCSYLQVHDLYIWYLSTVFSFWFVNFTNKKNLPNFIKALFLRCHVYGPKWFVMIHKREEMLTISWIEYEWNDIVICCLTPSLINERPYKGLLSFNKINTNLDQSVRLQKSFKYL